METVIFEVELTDNRTYRIFCGNRAQKKRFIDSFTAIKDIHKSTKVITNGIHTVTQWEKIIEHLDKN